MTVFRKTSQSMRKSIIAYAWKYASEHEDGNGNEGVFLVDEAPDWLQIWMVAFHSM